MKIQIQDQTRGTRIIHGDEVTERYSLLSKMINIANINRFEGIILPSVEPQRIYTGKAGKEILSQMYTFKDKKDRDLCLRPEATATIQKIREQFFATKKEARLWYFEKCWRYERPQHGRYREFWQFGCEILNPTDSFAKEKLIDIASNMIQLKTRDYIIDNSATRGLDYYIGKGFEIQCPQLGAQKQVCGGGEYKNGIGFAIGFDRLMLCK